DRNEEGGREDVHDRLDRLLDVVPAVGPRENETRGECADDRGGARFLGPEGGQKCERDRGRDEDAAHEGAVNEPHEKTTERHAYDDRDDQKTEGEPGRAERRADPDRSGGRELADDREDDEPQDVVGDGGTQDDLTFPGGEHSDLRQDPTRGADGTGRQSGAQAAGG